MLQSFSAFASERFYALLWLPCTFLMGFILGCPVDGTIWFFGGTVSNLK